MIDISANLSEEIDKAKTFAKSENLKCGLNTFMVVNVRGDLIDNGNQKSEYGFIELLPLTSEPNPQSVGDREGFSYNETTKAYAAGTGKMLDDGTTPNRVGEMTAVKANFTANRNVAAGKIKQFMLAAFGVTEDQTKPGQIGGAWDDASRQVAGWYVLGWTLAGNVVPEGTPNAKKQFVSLVVAGGTAMPVTKETPGAVWKDANPLAGFIIKCVTKNVPKKTPNAKGAFVGSQTWICIDPVGVGQNTPEACKERFAKHFAQGSMNPSAGVEDDDSDVPVSPSQGTGAPSNGQVVAETSAPTPPAPANGTPTPPVTQAADWAPEPPWVSYEMLRARGDATNLGWMKPGFVWNPTTSKVLKEADFRAGKRE